MRDRPTMVFGVIGLAAAATGLLDAFLNSEWKLLLLLGVAFMSLAAITARQFSGRAVVTLRPDLESWLRKRSQATGEPFDEAIDRTIAASCHGVYGNEQRH
ncbi:MAG: hypothetical protein R8J94_12820 [Acidimicrobiia bacterium]|nr:hypothetical protein [Acidimicrobiia bacterium]